MIQDMKFRFSVIIIIGFLGLTACHGDTNYATDVQSALLRNSVTSPQVGVDISGNVICSDCSAEDGMGVVVTGSLSSLIGNSLYSGIGGYHIAGTSSPGDTLTIKVTVTRGSGVTGKSVKVTVPENGGAIRQDIEF